MSRTALPGPVSLVLAALAQVREVLTGGMRQQVTRSGLAFVATTIGVALTAFISGNNLLFLLLAAMLATLLVSGFLSRLGLSALELELDLPDHLTAREAVNGRVRLTNRKRWLPTYALHLAGTEKSGLETHLFVPVLLPRQPIEEPVRFCFPLRGRHTGSAFLLGSRFPFGFAERRVQVTLARSVLVYPSLEAQPGFEELLAETAGQWEARRRGMGQEFYRVRPYELTESARFLDWRTTARTGVLHVREFARDEEPRVQLCLDVAVKAEHAAWFERAVECCAFLTVYLADRGAEVRLQLRLPDHTVANVNDFHAILEVLAVVAPQVDAAPFPPTDDDAVPLVFSADPSRWTALGWQARWLGPDDLPGPPADSVRATTSVPSPGAGANQRDRAGTGRGRGSGVRDGARPAAAPGDPGRQP